MKRENVFENDSPTLEMETQTQRSTQQGHQIPFVNGIPYPYQASAMNPSTAQYQQQTGFTINGNHQQITPNQFAPQYIPQGFAQPHPQPYPVNYFQPFAGNYAPGFFQNAYHTPYAQPFAGIPPYATPFAPAPFAPTPFAATPYQNQFAQPYQAQFAGIPNPQQNFGIPFQPSNAYQPVINIADGQMTMLPGQFSPTSSRNGSSYARNGERDFISWFPNVNILETDRAFKIEICVPGVTRENCRINVDKSNILRITGTRRWNQETDSIGFTRKDFNYGSFACSFVLTENLHKEKITSSCRNGLLIINIPKQENTETDERSMSDISVN